VPLSVVREVVGFAYAVTIREKLLLHQHEVR
jgi:hypothetical protein